MTRGSTYTARNGHVQSLQRAFQLLEHLAASDAELTLSELSALAGLPRPTAHRLLQTLVDYEYVRQLPSRRYALGARLIGLAESAGRQLGSWSRPGLAQLVAETGETANMAILDGDHAVYVAQVPSEYSMRMFAEVGRRTLPHCTSAGKVLLAQLSDDKVHAILSRTGMPAYTPRTVTDPAELIRELSRIRQDGYALDDGEQEVGVQCIAAPLIGAPTVAALSVSGPTGRITTEARQRIVQIVRRVAGELCSAVFRRDRDG